MIRLRTINLFLNSRARNNIYLICVMSSMIIADNGLHIPYVHVYFTESQKHGRCVLDL